MLIALGDGVAEASVIIATKGNKFNMQDDDSKQEYLSSLKSLQDLADKYNIKGGVLEFRGKYFVKGGIEDANQRDASKNYQKIDNQFE